MIMTFDFVLMAKRDSDLMREINCALVSLKNEVVYTEIHKLSFNSSKQILRVEPLTENSNYCYKIIPKDIKYSAVLKMLNDNWEYILEDEIMDVINNVTS